MEFFDEIDCTAAPEAETDPRPRARRAAPQDVAPLQSAKPNVRARLERMAARFGLWPAQIEANPLVAVEVVDACAHCHCAAKCERQLGGDRSAEIQAECPNVARYQALRTLR